MGIGQSCLRKAAGVTRFEMTVLSAPFGDLHSIAEDRFAQELTCVENKHDQSQKDRCQNNWVSHNGCAVLRCGMKIAGNCDGGGTVRRHGESKGWTEL